MSEAIYMTDEELDGLVAQIDDSGGEGVTASEIQDAIADLRQQLADQAALIGRLREERDALVRLARAVSDMASGRMMRTYAWSLVKASLDDPLVQAAIAERGIT